MTDHDHDDTEDYEVCTVCDKRHEYAEEDPARHRLYTCGDEQYVWCEWCYGWEPAYGRWGHEYTTLHNGDTVCGSCADEVRSCDECGDAYHYDDVMFHDRSDMYLCAGCYENAPHGSLSDGDGEHVGARIHFDVLRESFISDDQARELIERGGIVILACPLDGIDAPTGVEFTMTEAA